MSVLDNVKRGDRLTFTLVRSGIAGDSFNNVLVDSSLAGYSTARLVSTDVGSKHANLFPFFKDKVDGINDPSKYLYVVIKPNDLKEELIAVGIPWINEDSVKINQSKNLKLELTNFEEYKRPSLETYLKNAGISYIISE